MSNPYAANASLPTDCANAMRCRAARTTSAQMPAIHARGGRPRRPRLQAVALAQKLSQGAGRDSRPARRRTSTYGRGEFLAIIGQSGSGKSTLLHLLGMLDAPDAGEVHFDGRRIDNLPAATARCAAQPAVRHDLSVLSPAARADDAGKCALAADDRRRSLELSAGIAGDMAHEAKELLDMVGLGAPLEASAARTSGGEMQRTAIARALICGPQVLLGRRADRQPGSGTGREILRILRTLNAQQNLTIVMVTHDLAIAEEADRIVRLCEGRVEGSLSRSSGCRACLLLRGAAQCARTTVRRSRFACRSRSTSPASSTTRKTPRSASMTMACCMATACSKGFAATAGKVFRLDEHLDRLWNSAKAIWLEIPIAQARPWPRPSIETLLPINRLTDGYIRLVVTRGAGTLGLDPNRTSDPQVIIIADQNSLYPPELYEKGLEIVTASTPRNHPAALSPRIKSLNYLNNILAKIEGLQAGCIEALMLNHKGEVAECTGDNIFLVHDGVLLDAADRRRHSGRRHARGRDRVGREGRHRGARNRRSPGTTSTWPTNAF